MVEEVRDQPLWHRLTPGLSRLQRYVALALLFALGSSRALEAMPDTSWALQEAPTEWRTLSGDAITYEMPAINLLRTRGYSSSLEAPFVPSILRTPTYPLLIAAIYAVFGHRHAAVVAANVGFDLAAAVLLFLLAVRRLGGWWAVAVIPAYLFLSPVSFLLGFRLCEPFVSFLLALAVYVADPPRWTPARGVTVGLALGALLLCRPVFALLPAALSPILLFGTFESRRLKYKTAAAALAGICCLWGPWVARNAWTTDAFIPLSAGSSGLSLWLGTWHSGPSPWRASRDSEGRVRRQMPEQAFTSGEERKQLEAAFESYIQVYFESGGLQIREPDAIFRRAALKRIASDPMGWVARRTEGATRMLIQIPFVSRWSHRHIDPFRPLIALVLGLSALLGTALAMRRRLWWPILIAVWYSWIIHAPTPAEPRYLAPAYGLILLVSFFALKHVSSRAADRWASARS